MHPLLARIQAYRWPIGITAILGTSIAANAVLLYQATRPEAVRPIERYYARSLEWDRTLAVREASRALGWTATWDLPVGPEYAPSMPRPVDLVLVDRQGDPVRGLTGTLTAARPADPTLDGAAPVTELPHAPGTYRALLTFPADGLWEVTADLRPPGGPEDPAAQAPAWVASRRLDVRSEGRSP